MNQPERLFSVGHSNVSTERFVTLLHAHAIRIVCDVRSIPYSRYTPQFNREALADALPAVGIAYIWLGEALGGMPKDAGLRDEDGSADYTKIASTAMFQHGIDDLIALGKQAPTVFMCGEADYHGCHRHKLITPALIERGVAVWHIMADGKLEQGAIEPQQLRLL